MKNEKGVTLIELLAAVALFSLLMSTGFFLFSALNTLWYNSVAKNDFQARVSLATSLVTNEMADAVSFYMPSQNELRFRTFTGQFKMLYYDAASRSLLLKESSDATNLTDGTYEVAFSVEGVTGFSVCDENEVAFHPPARGENGELFYIKLSFEKVMVRSDGEREVASVTHPIALKLFDL
jgi:prepilin-type N-terminal cleavage/methylation domain-containing protein